MTHPNAERHRALLDWLDERNAWQFVAILYAARWVALAPILIVEHFVSTQGQGTAESFPKDWRQAAPLGLFVGLVVVPPILETLVECSLPYWVIARVRNYRNKRPNRCWGFVAVSACMMAILHPMLEALLPAFITGAFLAYCYAHFARVNVPAAILATAIFHGSINLVGWTMLVLK